MRRGPLGLPLLSPLVLAAAVSAAPGSFAFKAQVLHDRLGPMKRFAVTVDGKPTITDDGGVFQVPLANGTAHVVVAVSGSTYAIHYPYGGFVAVPRDLDDMPQIIVGNPKENDYLKQYLSLYQMVKRGAAAPAADLAALNKKMTALQDLLLQLHYSDADLRTAKQIQDRKDDYFPEITSDLVDFKTRAADLETAFKYTSDFAFENANALQKLQEAVVNYNYSYNKLVKQRLNYEKRIADYWQNESLKADFRRLMDLALDKVHLARIYPMQPIIAEVNRYFVGKNHDKTLRRRIQDDIGARVKDLEAPLAELDALTGKVLDKLTE